MATTPIYNWSIPDNTDLVKNGALAIRTLGDAIDTTMATMTPKSTFTAKGSIAAATAASTPANLSVGANDYFLQAASGESTGLKWGGAWTSYTPGASAQTGTITSYTSTGAYIKIGKLVTFYASVTLTNAGTGSNSLLIGLPLTAKTGAIFTFAGQESAMTGKALTGSFGAATSNYTDAFVRFYDFTTMIATNNRASISGTYEVA